MLPLTSTQKLCSTCQTRDRENQRAARARKKAAESEKTTVGQKRHQENNEQSDRPRKQLRTTKRTEHGDPDCEEDLDLEFLEDSDDDNDTVKKSMS